MPVRKLKPEEVSFKVGCLPEDARVRGNAVSSGNAEYDREVEDGIMEDLDRGNVWAWCTVVVSANWNGYEGKAYLGCCSYKSRDDFIANSGYYEQMKDEALAELQREVEEADANIGKIRL